MPDPAFLPRVTVSGHERLDLDDGWSAAACEPGAVRGTDGLDGLAWRAAHVPGTAAGVLRDAGNQATESLDSEDWWFRTRFQGGAPEPGEEVVLRLGGIATLSEVYLNGQLVVESESMFAAHAVDVGDRLEGVNELAIRCRALTPEFAVQRKPRARWRTRLVSDGSLRWFRTMILGRAPGFAPGPAAVGPWRQVWLERRRDIAVEDLALRTRIEGDDGILAVKARLRELGETPADAVEVELDGPSGRHVGSLEIQRGDRGVTVRGSLRVPSVARWWPHTHGDPALHDVRLTVRIGSRSVVVDTGRVGFRTLAAGDRPDTDVQRDGLDLHVNGVRVFARGAVWTPIDPVGLAPTPRETRVALEQVRVAGMNMLRVPGIGAYEDASFHDLCDELGLLVWQDFMFANLDYPFTDEAFRELAEREAAELLAGIAGRPSTAVLCGNSEVEQQVAMLGMDATIGRDPFFGETLPALARAAGSDAVYVPSAPSGGDLPFRIDRGIANYYGVGAYLRPLADARASGVRFAAECLAFANVPDQAVIDAMLLGTPDDFIHDPRWKAGVPRDVGADWDFDDVRDHYLALLFNIDPAVLRRADRDRYLELSRAVSGEVMAEVFGEWRRSGSASGGGLVLWLRDLVPGAGWGILDHRGEPKVAYHHLRRALSPLAVWLIDEGLGGIVAHVANDGGAPVSARLRIALYHDLEQPVGEESQAIELAAHDGFERNIETTIGHFVDASWAYRFGPPAQDLIVASLERGGDQGMEILSQAFRYPAGRPAAVEPADRLGLAAVVETVGDGTLRMTVSSRRFAYGVRVEVPGFRPDDDAFSVEPGGSRTVVMRPIAAGNQFEGGRLSALNLAGRVEVKPSGEAIAPAVAASHAAVDPR